MELCRFSFSHFRFRFSKMRFSLASHAAPLLRQDARICSVSLLGVIAWVFAWVSTRYNKDTDWKESGREASFDVERENFAVGLGIIVILSLIPKLSLSQILQMLNIILLYVCRSAGICRQQILCLRLLNVFNLSHFKRL